MQALDLEVRSHKALVKQDIIIDTSCKLKQLANSFCCLDVACVHGIQSIAISRSYT